MAWPECVINVVNYICMETKSINIPVTVLAYGELSEAERKLVEEAREATFRSYAPYSHFKVGAAIELADGHHATGSNQENVAYPSGTCAERSACYWAGAQYPGVAFRRVAVAARGEDDEFTAEPVAPCGACRQALLEYETLAGAPVELLLVGRDKVYRLPSITSTLPLAFTEF